MNGSFSKSVSAFLAFFILTVFFTGISFCQLEKSGDEPKIISKEKPKVVIGPPLHDMGKVLRGIPIKHVFTIKNVGDADLLIDSLRPD